MSFLGVVFAGVVGVSSVAGAAHPLGNFTTNTYAGLVVGAEHISVDYVLDLAEIPAQQVMPSIGDGYEQDRCRELANGLDLRVGGDRIELVAQGARLTFPAGLAGLPTLRLECDLVADTAPVGAGEVRFRDTNLEGTVGWREVTAVADGVRLVDSDVPERSVSGRLTAYPEGRRALGVTAGSFTVAPGGDAAPTRVPPHRRWTVVETGRPVGSRMSSGTRSMTTSRFSASRYWSGRRPRRRTSSTTTGMGG